MIIAQGLIVKKEHLELISKLIELAIVEDLGQEGDLTTKYFISQSAKARATIISKSDTPIVLSGLAVAELIIKRIDPRLTFTCFKTEGDLVNCFEAVLEITGSYQSILSAERIVLNFMQRMSGIATLTKQYVDQISGTNAKILDTRKTTPGFRVLAKQAVLAGGGTNHRMGLYDAVMVKDNHLVELGEDYLNKLQERILLLKKDYPDIFIVLEADKLEQVNNFLKLSGVNRILLDNMANAELLSAVDLNQGKLELEASGGVNLHTVRKIAETGVDFISVGALTHSAVAVDLSLEIVAL